MTAIIKKIFEHAHGAPDRIAIFDRGHRISYREFAFWISRAQQLLSQQDFRKGSIAVLLDVPCRLDAWAFSIALRSLGMTTIAVRSLETLNQLGVRNIGCVITTIRDNPLRIISTDADHKTIRIPNGLFLERTADGVPDLPETTFPEGGHILLTSGTTGASKKVPVDAVRLAKLTARRACAHSISERSTVNIFDYALWTGLGYYLPVCAWSMGGSVVFHQGEDPHRSLLTDGVTHAFITPAKLSELLSAPQDEIFRNEEMRLFVTAGPLSNALVSAARISLTSQIYTYVASTEVGAWTLTRIDRPADLVSHIIDPSVEVQVVDDTDRPLPPGQIGMVRIRTSEGSTGYLDDEEASRKIFRHGYFHPGDLGAFQEDGRLVLNGRVTNVINVLGYKIVAEPLEQALQDRLAADGVGVLSVPGEEAEEELHIVIQSHRPLGTTELTSAISSELPAGVHLAHVHFVTALARNDLGKIDRAALRQQIFAGRAKLCLRLASAAINHVGSGGQPGPSG